jgi:hypothetical protein
MARIRTIKPEFWQDELVASWPRDTRLVYIGLWTEADDEGRLRASPARLRSAILPYDDVTASEFEAMLKPILNSGRLRLYCVDGQTYGWLPKFKDHQRINRPSLSRLPPFTEESAVHPESALSPHGRLTEPSQWEGKGKEGIRESIPPLPPADAGEPATPTDPPPLALAPTEPTLTPKRRRLKGKPSPAGERILARLRELSGRGYEYSPELEARLREGIPEADLLAVVEYEARPDGLRDYKGGAYYQPSTLFRPTKIRERIAQARAAQPRARDAPEAPPLPDLDTIEARAATDAWLAQLPDHERERIRRQAEAALVARGIFPGDGLLRDEIARMARQHGGDHAA